MRFKILSVLTLSFMFVSCTSIPKSTQQIQMLDSDSTLINGCTKLGPINTDTKGNPFNFDSVAIGEFKRIAEEKYKADSAVITSRQALPLGRIVLQGTALKCYP